MKHLYNLFKEGKHFFAFLVILMLFAPMRMMGQETINIGYTCDFETYSSTTLLPEGWTRPDGTNASYPMVRNEQQNAYQGNCFLHFLGSTETKAQIAVLPEIAESIGRKRLSFYAKRSGSSYTLGVGYMTDPTDASTFVEIDRLSLTADYSLYSVEFGTYDGDPRYIAIRSNSTYTGMNYYIDDLSLTLAPPPMPTIQNCIAASNTATLEWTAGGAETAWDIYYSTDATAPTGETTPSVSNHGSTSYTINGLSEAVQYRVWVRANCGSEFSEWAGPAIFATPTQGQSALTVCFGQKTNSNVPTAIYTDYLFKTEFIYPGSLLASLAGREIQKLSFMTSQTTPYDQGIYRIFLKEVNLENFEETNLFLGTDGACVVYEGPLSIDGTGTMNVDFQIPFVYSGASNSNLLIGVYKTKTFEGSYSSYPWYGKEVSNAALYKQASSYSATLESISEGSKSNFLPRITFVHQTPTPCPKPARVVVSDVTAHTAEISWAAREDQDLWEIYYVTTEPVSAPGANTQPNIENITTNPFIWTNLIPETTYYAYLRSNCGTDNGTSEWSEMFTFTTTESCFVPTDLQVSALGATTASLIWIPGPDGQSLWEAYLTEDANDVPETNTIPTHPNLENNILEISNLIPEKTYYAYVRANCGAEDGVSLWSSVCSFSPTETTQLTVYDGAATNTVVPLRGGVNYFGKTEFVVPADELTSMAGTYISSMKFYGNKNTTSWVGTVKFDVYMKEVDFDEFNSASYADQDGATMVYQGKMTFNNSKEMSVTFTTPFYYEGGNLLVGFSNTSTTSSYNAESVTWDGETTTKYAAVSGYKSSSASSYTCSRYQFLPKTTFTYSNMLAPINLGVTYVGMHTATMRWSPDPVYTGQLTGWEAVYSTEADFNPYEATPEVINVPENHSIEWTDLTPNTQYFAYVRARNGDVHGPWSDIFTFRTAEYNPIVLNDDNPYYYDGFDGETLEWTLANGGNHWMRGRSSWISAPYAMYLSVSHSFIIDLSIATKSYVYKTFELEGGKKYEVSFDWRCKPLHTSTDFFDFRIYPADVIIEAGEYPTGASAILSERLEGANKYSWDDYYDSFEIPEGEGGSYVMVFSWKSDQYGSGGYYYDNSAAFDNFLINVYQGEAPRPTPPQPEPTEVTLPMETMEVEPIAWQIIYSTDPDLDPYTLDLSEFPDELPEGVVGVEITDEIPTLTGLDPETGYYVYVRAVYPPIKKDEADNVFSRWSEQIAFTTTVSCFPVVDLEVTAAADNATFAWNTDEDQPSGNAPATWNVRYKKDVQAGATTTYTFNDGLNPAEYVENWSVKDGSLISAGYAENNYIGFAIQLPCVVSFDAEGLSADVNYSVKASYDPQGNDLITSKTGTAFDGESNHVFFDFSEYEGTCYLVITMSYQAPMSIDNLTLDVPVWTTGTANGNTFTMNDLDSKTYYLFAVQAHCGEGDDSQWETTKFCTQYGNMEIPYEEDFDAYSNGNLPDGWSIMNNGQFPMILDDFYYSSGYSLVFYSTGEGDQYAILPPVENVSDLQMQFWSVNPEPSIAETAFNVGVMSDPEDPTTFVSVKTITTTYDWTKNVVYFKDYEGQGQYIAIRLIGEAETYKLVAIDDVEVSEAPSCFVPEALTVSNITTSSADVSWIPNGEETQWHLSLKLLGETDWNTPIVVENNPSYSFSNLTLGTAYALRVQAICAADDWSDWEETDFNTTFCDPQDQCSITYEFADDYGDGWNGARISVVRDGVEVASLTMLNGSTESGTLPLCSGDYDFVWVSGYYDDECSFIIYDPYGNEITSAGGKEGPSAGSLIETPYSHICGFTLPITGYGEGNGNFYLIASPLAEEVLLSEVDNLMVNQFDLYRFNQSAQQEWENYKAVDANNEPLHPDFTTLEPTRGYLYANSEDVVLTFTGAPYVGEGKVTLIKDANATLSGWNLVGNPYAKTAYLVGDRDYDFYVMNEDGNQIIAATEPGIAPMQGVFVEAEEDEEELFFTTEAVNPKGGLLALNIGKERSGVVDRAIVRFGQDRKMSKFQIRNSSTKIYLPKDNRDYAVVSAEPQGEMPVNFKAETHGIYTLSFNTQNIEMGYLHLIDNLTGNDIDLLKTPSYSFEAHADDYASRFKLVYAAGDLSDDHFAFIGNGEIILTEVSGRTTVQLFDVTGRMLVSTNGANRISIENMAAGVYVIRLVNGNEVKTQKLIIR